MSLDDFPDVLRARLRAGVPRVDVDTTRVIPAARRRRRRTRIAAAAGTLALTAGIAVSATVLGPALRTDDLPPATGTPSPTDASAQEYRYTGMVIGRDGAAPVLCGGVVYESYPPGCTGAPVIGWDWSTVTATREGDVSWGEYEVVGTWDGSALTLTRPVVPFDRSTTAPPDLPDFSTPCPEPAQGWVPLDPERTSSVTMDRGIAAAAAIDGFAVAWIDRNPGTARPEWVVLNVLTSGDVAATEAAVREHWGGALCVTGGAARSAAELDAVVTDLIASEPPPCAVGPDPFEGRVDVTVWVATPELQESYDRRYGRGLVHLEALLAPVS